MPFADLILSRSVILPGDQPMPSDIQKELAYIDIAGVNPRNVISETLNDGL